MCELLGISSARKVDCNDLLNPFFSHASEHPDGWGLARFYGNSVSLEKEPVSALESVYLKNRLTDEIREDILIAHIRKASVGNLSYQNSHPFARRDASGRLWTLAHNGTIFESPVLEPYAQLQNGSTDSERILYYLVDRINAGGNPGALSAEERFSIVEDVIRSITPKNMVNLLIYDGDLFYVHANRKDSLHMLKREDSVVISTKALSQTGWEPVPLNIPLAFQCGRLVYTGRNHGNEYIKEETDTPQQKLSTEGKARQ